MMMMTTTRTLLIVNFIIIGFLLLLLLHIITSSFIFIQVLAVNSNDSKIGCNASDYIVILKNNISASPKAVSEEYKTKGVMVTHVYESALEGFAIKIPENLCNTILNDLRNDSRIANFEPDNKVSIQ